MGRGTWKDFELILLFRGRGGHGSQFPGLEESQRKDMKHVKRLGLVAVKDMPRNNPCRMGQILKAITPKKWPLKIIPSIKH